MSSIERHLNSAPPVAPLIRESSARANIIVDSPQWALNADSLFSTQAPTSFKTEYVQCFAE